MSPQVSEIASRTDAGEQPDRTAASARFLTGLAAAGAAVVGAALLAAPGTSEAPPWTIVGVVALVLFLVCLVGFAAAGWGPTGRRQRLLRIGALSGIAALVAVVVALLMRLFLPLPLQTVLIQFSDLAGRVQIEYCPTLPQSFAGSTTAAELHGSGTVVAVKVTGDVCGSAEFVDGVWLYLARSSITIGAE